MVPQRYPADILDLPRQAGVQPRADQGRGAAEDRQRRRLLDEAVLSAARRDLSLPVGSGLPRHRAHRAGRLRHHGAGRAAQRLRRAAPARALLRIRLPAHPQEPAGAADPDPGQHLLSAEPADGEALRRLRPRGRACGQDVEGQRARRRGGVGWGEPLRDRRGVRLAHHQRDEGARLQDADRGAGGAFPLRHVGDQELAGRCRHAGRDQPGHGAARLRAVLPLGGRHRQRHGLRHLAVTVIRTRRSAIRSEPCTWSRFVRGFARAPE